MFAKLRAFGRNEDGAATIEFVAVFVGFIAVLMFVVETSIYLFFMASVEKAAEAGARVAAMSYPVRGAGVLLGSNQRNDSGISFGTSCSSTVRGEKACAPFDEIKCGREGDDDCGGSRNSPQEQSLRRIVAEMRKFNGNITEGNVTVAYTDVGIGFAGGPRVPMVTVTISGLGFETGIFGLLLNNTAGSLGQMPARSASMTGESLGQ